MLYVVIHAAKINLTIYFVRFEFTLKKQICTFVPSTLKSSYGKDI
jgi:hypothetical protein